ncbi:MAG: DUF2244 domain-containing protein [Rubricella sp.]
MVHHTEHQDRAGERSPALADSGDAPLYAISLWPHRSMGATGVSWLMGLVAIGLSIPLVPFLGTPVAWGLLPFMVLTIWLLYLALRSNYRAAEIHEELALWPDLIRVTRTDRRDGTRAWEANPHWVQITLHTDQKIENYLTLRGNGREIELGSFLTADERKALHDDISRALSRLR